MRRIFYSIILYLTFFAPNMSAAPIDDAKEMFGNGDYAGAIELLLPLHNKSPKDGTIAYYLGASYYNLGDYEQAEPLLRAAQTKNVPQASQLLAELAVARYDVDQADEELEKWQSQLAKSKRQPGPDFDRLKSKIVTMRNMLDRVDDIVIVDSISVDEKTFFEYYRLSPDAGTLSGKNTIPASFRPASPGVIFTPADNREKFWASADSTGTLKLMSAIVLDDGTIDSPQPLIGNLNEGGHANFPFMLSDGVTLYYANDGENSLGGYDIFMTRRNGTNEFYDPQNVGMPYNSPYNDYMLAIDETNGVGWWATDRNSEPGKVTIYTYLTNDERRNLPTDDPEILSRAMLTSIAQAQPADFDASAVKNRIRQSLSANSDDEHESDMNARAINLSLGNGKVYTSLSDFRNSRARDMMLQLLDRQDEVKAMEAQLDDLRARYAKGNISVDNDIISLEKRIAAAQTYLRQMRNQIIIAETR